jgi:ubiquinol-cytochrome c reductase cytochrome b subunit
MAEAFMGYLLPWGQMSFWGAQVIVNLFSSVPFVGPDLSVLIRGDYVISDATLNRFFALHVAAIPLVLVGIIFVHLIALHKVGSNNPDGIEIKKHKHANGHPMDGIPFHPYYTVKDMVGVAGFLIIFCAIVFFAPDLGGYFLEANNFVPANPMQTPAHIAPVWYFTPYYAILRAVPPMFGSQFPGVIAMGVATIAVVFLPWLDRGKVKSIRYRGPIFKAFLAAFVVTFIGLGYLGLMPATPTYTLISRILSVVYFAFFILMPWYTKIDKCKPEPDRVTF